MRCLTHIPFVTSLQRMVGLGVVALSLLQPLFAQDRGNITAQEYGDAVYRYYNPVGWIPGLGYDYNHTGIFAGVDSNNNGRVLQAYGPGISTQEVSFSEVFTSFGTSYYGAYTLNNRTMTFTDRKSVVKTASDLANAVIPYPPTVLSFEPFVPQIPYAILYYGTTFDGSIGDISNIRCDGFVEYAYEKNGYRVWRNTTYPDTQWSIVDHPDSHNDRPDNTRNPDTELSPWSQRGAPSTTGPYVLGSPYSGPPYPDTKMTSSAVISFPTYQITQVAGTGFVDVTVTATDESGIHYIGYKKPGDASWSYSPTQPRNTTSASSSYTVRVTSSGTFYAFAMDNGGNIPTSTPGYSVTIGSAPSAPTGVNATDGAYTDKVVIIWNPVSGATYELWRNTSNDSASATLLGTGITGTTFDNTSAGTGTTYYYWVKAVTSGGTSAFSASESGYRAATVLAPSFTTHPTNQTVAVGGNIGFTAAAIGTPTPTYQWQYSTNGGSSWANVPSSAPYAGVGTGTLSITGAITGMNGYQYRCVASNSVNITPSNAATLTVIGTVSGPLPPQLFGPGTATPSGGASTSAPVGVPYGFNVSLSFVLNYQIQITDTVSNAIIYTSPFTTFSNFGIATMAVPYASLPTGRSYSWIARSQDSSGNPGVWSSPYYFSIPPTGPLPPQLFGPGTVAPSGATTSTPVGVPYGFNVSLSFVLNYQVQITDTGSNAIIYTSPFTTFTNFGIATIAVPYASLPAGRSYSWIARSEDSSGYPGVWSSPYYFSIPATTSTPSITTQPVSKIVAVGSAVTFTVAASGTPPPTYQWKKNGTGIPGATNSSYTIASVVAGDAGSYTVVATNSAGSATSNAAILETFIAAPSNAVISFTIE